MSNKIKLFVAPLALIAGAAFAVPAAAQNYSPYEMRMEINHLQERVEQIGETSRFTKAEYRRMQNAVDSLASTYREYGRNGFTRREVAVLNDRIDNVRARIHTQARDGQRLRR